MSKKPTLTEITSGFLSSQKMSENFTLLKDAFDNTISRDGSTPNAMSADLDMDSNDILNVQNLGTSSLTLNGVPITPNTTTGTGATTIADGLMTKEDKVILDDLRGQSYNLTSEVEADNIPSTVDYLRILSTDATYKRVVSEPSHDGKIQSLDGAHWEYDPSEVVKVQVFGSDDTAIIKALTFAAGRPVSGGGKTITLGSTQEYTGEKYNLRDMHLDCTGGGRLFLNGGLTAIPDLGANISRGDRSVTFTSAHGLSVGDVFCVYNPTALSFYDDGSSGNHAGDWFEVQAVTSSTVVAISEGALDDYAVADVDCYVMGGKGGTIENVSGTNAENGVISLEVKHHKGILERGCTWSEATTPATPQLARNAPFYHMCFDGAIYAPSGAVSEGSNSYARSLSHCKYFTIHGATLTSDWHAISIGGGTGAGSVPNRFITVEGSNLRAIGDVGAADIHSECDHVGYRNTRALQGIQMNGRNSFVDGCYIQSRNDSAPWGINGEPNGGHYRIKNTVIEVPYDASSSRGAIDFNALANISEDLILEIDELTVINHDTTSALRLIKLDVTDVTHSHKIKLKIGRLNVEGATPFAVVSITGAADVSSQLTVEILSYHGPGTEYMVVSNTANNDCTLSLPSQTMKADASLTTGVSSVTSGVLTYPCRYPRIPEVMGATFHRTDSASYSPTMTTNFPVLFPFDVEENFIRGTLKSSNGGNFNEAADVQMVLTVGINDV